MSEITVTLKGGRGSDQPWIIIKGESLDEVTHLLDELAYDDLMWKVGKLSQRFQEETPGE